jgi:hypothetical protein
MSSPELRRVEVLARVKSKDLKLTDAAELAAGDEIHLGNARVAFQPDPTQTV